MSSPGENDEIQEKSFDKRYILGELLGKGASSSAYKARDLLLERDIVVKVIHPHLLTSELAIQRFKTEAALCSSLSHPAIARVYNSGVTADGRLYLVMDYIEGRTLAEILADESKLSLPDFFSFFSDLLSGVEHAHEKKIVHRDIKPSNIIVKRENGVLNAVLIDFGLAKSIEAEAQSSTNTGLLLGSAGYMSPEQCRGEKSIDQRSDIYSIGCVMSEALIGTAPFSGGTDLEVMSRHLEITQKRLGFLKKLPPSLAKLIKKCLERDAQDRYQNLAELKHDFEQCKVSKDCLKKSISDAHQDHKRSIAVLALLICCAGFFYYISSTKKARSKSPDLADVLPNRGIQKVNSRLPIRIEELTKKIGDINTKSTKANQDADQALEYIDNWEKRYAKQFDATTSDAVKALRVQQLCKLDRMDEAKVIVESLFATSFFPRASAALYAYMSRLVELRQFREAIVIYGEFEKKFPEIHREKMQQVIFLRLLGDCYMGLGDYKSAKLEYSKSWKVAQVSGDAYIANDDEIAGASRMLTACFALRDERGINECVASVDRFFENNEVGKAKADLALTRLFAVYGYTERLINHAQRARTVFKKNAMKTQLQEADRYLANQFLAAKKYAEAQKLEEEFFSIAPSVKGKVMALTMLSVNALQRGDKAAESKYIAKAFDLAKKALDKFFSGDKSQSKFDCEDAYQSAISRVIDMYSEDLQYMQALDTAEDGLKLYGKQFPEIGLFLYRKKLDLTNVLGFTNADLLSEHVKGIEELLKEMQEQPISSKQNSYILEGKAEIARLRELLFRLQNDVKMLGAVAKSFFDEYRNDIRAEPYLVEQAYVYCSALLELKQYAELKTFLNANSSLMMNVKMSNLSEWIEKSSNFVLYQISVQNYEEAQHASLASIEDLRTREPEQRWLQFRFYLLLAEVYGKTKQADKRKQCLVSLKEIGKYPLADEQAVNAILNFVWANYLLQPDRELALHCMDIIQNSAPESLKCLGPYRKSLLYLAGNELPQRITLLKQCLTMNMQQNTAMKVFYNDVKVELAVAYTDSKQWEEAKHCLNEVRRFAVESDSHDSWQKELKIGYVDHLMGNVYAAKKDNVQAIAYYKKAIAQFAKLGNNGLNKWTSSISAAISCAQEMKDESELQKLEALKKAGVSQR